MEREVKGIWIPIELWQNSKLTWNEKILFLEIDSFTKYGRDCYISDEYIAELLGVSMRTASRMVNNLISYGYVEKTRFDGRKRYIRSTQSVCYDSSVLPPVSYDTDGGAGTPNLAEQTSHFCRTNNNRLINKINNKEKEEILPDGSIKEESELSSTQTPGSQSLNSDIFEYAQGSESTTPLTSPIAETQSLFDVEKAVEPIVDTIDSKQNQKKKKSSAEKEKPIMERQRDFYDRLRPYVGKYPKEILRGFYDYWTEQDSKTGKKLRFEDAKFFDIGKRLATWKRIEESRTQKWQSPEATLPAPQPTTRKAKV